jgi:hypothetical protein
LTLDGIVEINLPPTVVQTSLRQLGVAGERLGDAARDVQGDCGRRRHRTAAAASSSRPAGDASVKAVDWLRSGS